MPDLPLTYWRLEKIVSDAVPISTLIQGKEIEDNLVFWNGAAGGLEFALHLVPGGTAADYAAGGSSDAGWYVALQTAGDITVVGGWLARGTKVASAVAKAAVVVDVASAGTAAAQLALNEEDRAAHAGDFLLQLVALGLNISPATLTKKLDDLESTPKRLTPEQANELDKPGPVMHQPVAPKGLPVPDAAELSKLGAAPGKGQLTKAGHSLSKHAAGKRQGSSAFPDPKGSAAQINMLAQQLLEDILTDPARVVKQRLGRPGETLLQISRPDGSGVIFKWTGTGWQFSHFAENLY